MTQTQFYFCYSHPLKAHCRYYLAIVTTILTILINCFKSDLEKQHTKKSKLQLRHPAIIRGLEYNIAISLQIQNATLLYHANPNNLTHYTIRCTYSCISNGSQNIPGGQSSQRINTFQSAAKGFMENVTDSGTSTSVDKKYWWKICKLIWQYQKYSKHHFSLQIQFWLC